MILEAERPYHRLDQFKVLHLNADYQPLSYCPLSLLNWQDVMILLVKGWQTGDERIRVLEVYNDVYVHTASKKYQLPSVVASVEYLPLANRKKVPFTKFNLLLRDDFTCQYSGVKLSVSELTYDHVIPKSKGGKTNWTNVVACDQKVNERKANRTPKEAGLSLMKKPIEPTFYELWQKGRKYPPNYLHETWIDYLYYDTELEQT